MGATERGYSAGQFMLILDGQPSLVSEFEGLDAKADVVSMKGGPERYQMKHISNFEYSEASMKMGMSMGGNIYGWIQSTFDKDFVRKSGTIAAADYNYRARSYRHFTDALITEIGLPACDASSKDSGFITVKFKADSCEYAPGDNADLKGETNTDQKRWMASNFRFKIGGLDCSTVKKVSAYTIKQKVTTDRYGESRGLFNEPTALEFPELEVTWTAKQSIEKQWQQEFHRIVQMGDTSKAAEMEATLEYLSHDLKTVLGTINFHGCGFVEQKESKREANKDGARELTTKFYVENVTLDLPKK
jgi:hypothetical protein